MDGPRRGAGAGRGLNGADPLSVPERHAVRLALVCCALLAAAQWGWLPGFERAWGFNLWQYQHPAFGGLLLLSLLPLASEPIRAAVLAALAGIGRRFGSDRRARFAGLLAIALGFWLLRERRFFGDSTILVYQAMSGSQFAFPELGASWLLGASMRLGARIGAPGPSVFQLWVCASGAIAAGCMFGAARMLAADRRGAGLLTTLVLCGGVARVFAGHVEVYAFTLACATAYLWAATAYLRGRCSLAWVGLAFGVGLWMHLAFAFFAPSLALLPVLAEPGRSIGHYARHWSVAAALGAAPTAAFLTAIFAFSDGADLAALVASAQAAVGAGGGENRELWLRGWGTTAGAGTRYVSLSAAHLKYLANALFILAPAALPLLVWFARQPRRFVATPQTTFLAAASASMLVYCVVLRPVWGPYDWDLFSLPAVCLACLAGHLLVSDVEPARRSHLALLMIAATLAFVTLPLLAVGVATPRDAGPFSDAGISRLGDETPEQAFDRQIGPWL